MSSPGSTNESVLHKYFGSDVINEHYFHGWLPREDLRYLFQQHGDFLVRITEAGVSDGKFEMVLSALFDPDGKGRKRDGLVVEEDIVNLIIHNAHNKYYMGDFLQFNNVDNLVDHYLRHSLSVRNVKMKLKRPICLAQWELRADDVHLQDSIDKLGCIEIRKGYFQRKNTRIDAAVTMVHGRSPYAKQSINEMLRQCRLLRNLRHPCVIAFYGVCLAADPCCFLLEYVSEGPLDEYVKSVAGNLTRVELLRMVMSAGWGLNFIHSKNILHRDLSARNCFYDKQLVKISGFGLARKTSVYAMKSLMKLPVQWMAPETLKELRFTQKSDVYSFGVLIYEIFSQGEPYEGYTSQEAKAYIMDGIVNDLPPETPGQLVNFVKDRLWDMNPDQRPNMKEVTDWLASYTGFKLQMGAVGMRSTVRQNPEAPAWRDVNYKKVGTIACAAGEPQKTTALTPLPVQMLSGTLPGSGQQYENLACLSQAQLRKPPTQQLMSISPTLSRLTPTKPVTGQASQQFTSRKTLIPCALSGTSMKPMVFNASQRTAIPMMPQSPTSQRDIALSKKQHASIMSVLNVPIPGQADYDSPAGGAMLQSEAPVVAAESFDEVVPFSPDGQVQIPALLSPLPGFQSQTGAATLKNRKPITGQTFKPLTSTFADPLSQPPRGTSTFQQRVLHKPVSEQQNPTNLFGRPPNQHMTRTVTANSTAQPLQQLPGQALTFPINQALDLKPSTLLQFQQLLQQVASVPDNFSNKAIATAIPGQIQGTAYDKITPSMDVPQAPVSARGGPATKPLTLQQFQELLRQTAALPDNIASKAATTAVPDQIQTAYGTAKLTTSVPQMQTAYGTAKPTTSVPQSPLSAAGGPNTKPITLQQFQELLRQTAALPDSTSSKAVTTAVPDQMQTAYGTAKLTTSIPQSPLSATGENFTLQQLQQLLRQTAALPNNISTATAVPGQMQGATSAAGALGPEVGITAISPQSRQQAQQYPDPSSTSKKPVPTMVPEQMRGGAYDGTKEAANVPRSSLSAAGGHITLQQFQQLLQQTDTASNKTLLTTVSGQMQGASYTGAEKAANVPQSPLSTAGLPGQTPGQQEIQQSPAMLGTISSKPLRTAVCDQTRGAIGMSQMPQTAIRQITTNRPVSLGGLLPQGYSQTKTL